MSNYKSTSFDNSKQEHKVLNINSTQIKQVIEHPRGRNHNQNWEEAPTPNTILDPDEENIA